MGDNRSVVRSLNDIELLGKVGSGSFGDVLKGRIKRSDEFVAVKVVELDYNDENLADLHTEIAILSQCSSSNIVRYYGSFVEDGKLVILMEYMGGGSLKDVIEKGPLSEDEIAFVMRETLKGVAYLHKAKKLHRDIKAANILLSDNGEVKLADFGVSNQLSNASKRFTIVGSPYCTLLSTHVKCLVSQQAVGMAPEVIQRCGYDEKADIWSIGITAIELAMGRVPRGNEDPLHVLTTINSRPVPSLPHTFSKNLRQFVQLCLQKNPQYRPTAEDLLLHCPLVQSSCAAPGKTKLVARISQLKQSSKETAVTRKLENSWTTEDESTIARYKQIKPIMTADNLFALKCKICDSIVQLADIDQHSIRCSVGLIPSNNSANASKPRDTSKPNSKSANSAPQNTTTQTSKEQDSTESVKDRSSSSSKDSESTKSQNRNLDNEVTASAAQHASTSPNASAAPNAISAPNTNSAQNATMAQNESRRGYVLHKVILPFLQQRLDLLKEDETLREGERNEAADAVQHLMDALLRVETISPQIITHLSAHLVYTLSNKIKLQKRA